jgi:pre-mRNA cleavage complex 2 protein Pcf11
VKNVGTPYTLFLGRNLYQTFMNAYTLVDQQTRRKLDEMLKTWKEPVPGSLDPRPVFPVEITRGIENALIKARTAALQQQQDVMSRSRGSATPSTWAHTPTPPPARQAAYTNGHEVSANILRIIE